MGGVVGVNVEVEGSSLGPEKFRPKRKFEREKNPVRKIFNEKKFFFHLSSTWSDPSFAFSWLFRSESHCGKAFRMA